MRRMSDHRSEFIRDAKASAWNRGHQLATACFLVSDLAGCAAGLRWLGWHLGWVLFAHLLLAISWIVVVWVFYVAYVAIAVRRDEAIQQRDEATPSDSTETVSYLLTKELVIKMHTVSLAWVAMQWVDRLRGHGIHFPEHPHSIGGIEVSRSDVEKAVQSLNGAGILTRELWPLSTGRHEVVWCANELGLNVLRALETADLGQPEPVV